MTELFGAPSRAVAPDCAIAVRRTVRDALLERKASSALSLARPSLSLTHHCTSRVSRSFNLTACCGRLPQLWNFIAADLPLYECGESLRTLGQDAKAGPP